MRLAFRAVVRIRGVNPYVLVSRPRAVVVRANWKRPLPVVVRLNDQRLPVWRTNLMPVGDGRFLLYLHGGMRTAAKAKVGDHVRVEMAFDRAYRGGPQHPAPRWFTAALDARPRAAQGWAALSLSRKKELVRYFARLKSGAARTRNLTKAIHVLSGGRGRFMGRNWNVESATADPG